MFIIINPRIYQLQKGGWTGEFDLDEHRGDSVVSINYFLGKDDVFNSKLDAMEAIKSSAIRVINDKYPEGTKYRIKE